ncbi:MAG: glycosyltransferase family 2 protein [Chloroflexi bacterium]|nr:glycosyltransferase family 2 protein [Chloroflexota bacterium]
MITSPVMTASTYTDESDAFPDAQSLDLQTSVIIVAYNSGDLLRDCVASIRSTRSTVEIVVVDNASTDGAVERVKAEFPSIRAVRSERNTGFGAGNNLGTRCAKGTFLVFLNPDAIVTDGWLEAMVRPLAEDSSIGLVTPKVLLQNNSDRINVTGLNVHLSGISMCRGLGDSRVAFDEATLVAAISGVAFAVRREVFEAVGGFDKDFFLYMEDVDLSLRVWLEGYRCLYVPQAVIRHDYDEVEVGTRKTFYVEQGRYLMLLKSFSWRTLLGLLPTLLLVEVITWGWLLSHNPRAIVQKIHAYRWVLAHRMQIAQKRRHVQARRACPDMVFLDQCQWRLDFAQLAGPRMARVAWAIFGPFLHIAAGVARLVLGRGERCVLPT